MGKGELWDDSALLNAFDDAMSNYKKMHAKKTNDFSTDGEESHGAIRDAEEKNNSLASNTLKTMGETENLSLVQEDHSLDSVDCQPCVDSSSGQHKQAVTDCLYTQNLEGYNQLLNQYYELEEKRQMIFHQLQQLGGYDYQTSAEGFGSSQQLGTCCTSHNHSFSTGVPFLPTVAGSCCCPYPSHCSAAPCISVPCCSLGGTCASKMCDNLSALTCHKKSAPLTDGGIVKTAMEAAEKALSSIKSMESTNCSTEEKGKDNVEEIAKSISSDTDLSLVLNAWYSAGFYTGKYYTEQLKKGQ
ncbi:uncharacterized protein [Euphorbia lathyris]|uniref:uncharacterized protein isoform X1 n=1 Tax=Euphorbia lathyris TaxID=212925 RepID=UPI003313BA8B